MHFVSVPHIAFTQPATSLTIDATSNPDASSSLTKDFSFTYTLDVAATSLGISLTHDDGTFLFSITDGAFRTVGEHTLVVDPFDVASSVTVTLDAAAFTDNLPDGVYSSITLTGVDTNTDPISVVRGSVEVTLDTFSVAPTLTAAEQLTQSLKRFVQLSFSLPEGSTQLVVVFDGDTDSEVTVGISSSATSLFVDVTDFDATSGYVSNTGDSSLPQGSYTISIRAADEHGHAAASSNSISGVAVDYSTITPTLESPADGSQVSTIPVKFTLPEDYSSLTLRFARDGSTVSTISFTTGGSLSRDFTLPTTFSSATGYTVNPSPSTLTSGSYTATLTYNDLKLNGPQSDVNTFTIDTVTTAPSISSPNSNDQFGLSDEITFSFNIPEGPLSGSTRLIFLAGGSENEVLNAVVIDDSGLFSFSWDPSTDIDDVSQIAFLDSGSSTLSAGTYDVRIEYQDSLGNDVASDTVTGIVLDFATEDATLTAPADGFRFTESTPLTIQWTIPELASSGSLSFEHETAGTAVFEIDPTATPGTHTFVWNGVSDPTAEAEYSSYSCPICVELSIDGSTVTTIPEGDYTVTLAYSDAAGNTAVQESATFTIDRISSRPTGVSPSASVEVGSTFDLVFTVPEIANAGRILIRRLDFGLANLITIDEIDTYPAGTEVTIPIDLHGSVDGDWGSNLSGGDRSNIENANVCDQDLCRWGLVVGLQDTDLNPSSDGQFFAYEGTGDVFRNNGVYMTFDIYTRPLSITSPLAGQTFSSVFSISFSLGEQALDDELTATFTNTDTLDEVVVVFDVEQEGAFDASHVYDIQFHTRFAGLAPAKSTTASVIFDGTYNITLTYQDIHGNKATFGGSEDQSTTISGVVFDFDAGTVAPALSSPLSNQHYSSPLNVAFTVPEEPESGTIKVKFTKTGGDTVEVTIADTSFGAEDSFSWDFQSALAVADSVVAVNPPSATLTDGTYSVSITYEDKDANPPASFTATSVVLDTTTVSPSLTSPLSNRRVRSMRVRYTIADTVGSASLVIKEADNTTYSLGLAAFDNVDFTWDLSTDPSLLSTFVKSSDVPVSGLPEGTYSVSLSYTDKAGNVSPTVSRTNIVVDLTTETPSLTLPTGPTSNTIIVSAELPEEPLGGSVKLLFVGGDNEVSLVLQDSLFAAGVNTLFAFDSTNPTASAFVSSVSSNTGSGATLVDGTYTVTLTYQDLPGNAASSAQDTLELDTTTLAPTLSSPTSNQVIAGPVTFTFTLPEEASSASLLFAGSASSTQLTLTLDPSLYTAGVQASFTWDPQDALDSEHVIGITGSDPLPDELYTVTLSYSDVLGNPSAASSVSLVRIDTATKLPLLVSPSSGESYANLIPISYVLTETPLSGSVTITVSDSSTQRVFVTLKMADSTTDSAVSFSLSPSSNYAAMSAITSGTGTLPNEGSFDVTLSYQDASSNPVTSVTATFVGLDSAASPPTIYSPLSDSSHFDALNLTFSFPEAAKEDTVKITFLDTNRRFADVVLTLESEIPSLYSFHWDTTTNPASLTQVKRSTASSLPDGTYNVTVAYTDAGGNQQSAVASFVTIDATTLVPFVSQPVSLGIYSDPVPIALSLPESPSANTFKIEWEGIYNGRSVEWTMAETGLNNRTFSWYVKENAALLSDIDSATTFEFETGRYNMYVTYQDENGNPSATTTVADIFIDPSKRSIVRVEVVFAVGVFSFCFM